MSKKPRTDLVALGSAAVLAVYAAGFVRTRSAAQLFAQETDDRRHPGAPPSATDAAAPVVVTRPTTGTTTVKVAPPVTGAKALAKDSVPAAAADPVAVPVAAAPVAPPAPEPTPVATADTAVAERHVVWRDGVFTGWGTSRHGNIQASVEIKDGRIIAATITQCLTRYSCSWISALPPQVVARQSPEVDYVSGATQSTNAFYWAVVEALKQAK